MSDKKKRHHYVWREYLKPWALDEKIWTLFRDQNKILCTGLMGVAQERYFYKLVTFSKEEETFLENFIQHTCHQSVQPLCNDFLAMFTSHYKLQSLLDQKTDINIDKIKIQAEIDKLEANLMEDAHCKFESSGFNLINCRETEDFQFLEKPEDRNDMIIFLSIQYFRTKKMKNAVLNNQKIDSKKYNIEKLWNIISICLALTMACYISINRHLKFIVFKNKTSTPFITSDQPIFNLLNDKLDENGNVLELELFYPISPSLAVSVRFDNKQNELYNIVPINDAMANYLNKKMFENSDYFVFAESENQLSEYKTK